jgi:hypothetical protein
MRNHLWFQLSRPIVFDAISALKICQIHYAINEKPDRVVLSHGSGQWQHPFLNTTCYDTFSKGDYTHNKTCLDFFFGEIREMNLVLDVIPGRGFPTGVTIGLARVANNHLFSSALKKPSPKVRYIYTLAIANTCKHLGRGPFTCKAMPVTRTATSITIVEGMHRNSPGYRQSGGRPISAREPCCRVGSRVLIGPVCRIPTCA